MLTNAIRCCLPIVGVILLISCTSVQKETAQPKLSDLATPVPKILASGEHTGEEPSVENTLTVLYAYRFIIPLDSDLTEALSPLNTDALPAQAVKNYLANGLRVGVVDMQGYLHLKDNLPVPSQDPRTPDEPPKAILDARAYRLTGTNKLIPLSVTPYVSNSFSFKYTSPNGNTQPITLTKGRNRFLTRITKLPTGENNLALTPQHHLLKNTLMPRTPEQTTLDGRVFHDLAINAVLNENRLLVLACDIPREQEPVLEQPLEDEESAEVKDDKVEAEDDEAGTYELEDDAPEESLTSQITIPDNLGAHWLLAKRQGKTVQMILIFQIQNQ